MIGKTRRYDSPAAAPRGVLRRRLDAGEFSHERRLPSPALAAWVEHHWFVGWNLEGLPDQAQHTLPHPNVHLVVEQGCARVYGIHAGRFTRVLQGRGQVFGIKFKPGGFQPFLGAPVSTLADRSVAAADCFGPAAEAFEAEVAACEEVDEMADAAERLLLTRLPPEDPQARRTTELVARIAADLQLRSVEQLAAQEGMSPRALQRLFRHYVGVGPKWVINRYRMHEAVAQLQQGRPVAWAELALQLGYFDQAHFIRDFRRLVGQSPAAYERQQALRINAA